MEKVAPPLLPLHPPMLSSHQFYDSSNTKKRDLLSSYDVVHIPNNDNWNPKEWNWDSIRFMTAKSTVELQQTEQSLNLNLGSCPGLVRGNKRIRSGSPTSASYPMCQVDNCKEDLSKAKDYHRRHKVCEAHSKASKALLGNQMQRFCQQCSRFHPLLEFDEGKRSCRRRLAGHNRRRRKTQPDEVAVGGSPPLNQVAANLEIFNLLTAIADGSQGLVSIFGSKFSFLFK